MIHDVSNQLTTFFFFSPASSSSSPADKSKNKGGRGSKKQVFESYMTPEDVSHGLKRGELIQVQIQI